MKEEYKDMLVAEITDDEIKKILWLIDGNKSLGPNGYGSKFFKDCW